MESAQIKRNSSRNPTSPPDDLRSHVQLSEDVKIEPCSISDGGTSSLMKLMKEEEAEDEDYLGEENQQHGGTLKIIKLEEDEDFLYCEQCSCFFFNKCEVHGPALFVPDSPVPMGVTDRARRSLPPGLEVGESGIPDAGLGVFNTGDPVPVGAHFGPYQGELVEREEAMSSAYSWVIYKSSECEEYIDAAREIDANWMRYVNCAGSDEEQNLVVFQYRGGIYYRCCRAINPGQELLVCYDEGYGKNLSSAFDHIWNRKCCSSEVQNHLCGKSFSEGSNLQRQRNTATGEKLHHCSQCRKSFRNQRNLQQHQDIHKEEKPHHCSFCGKSFTRQGQLQLHQRIHTREKPFQCSECPKSFTYQSNFKVHQRLHSGGKPHHCSECGKRFKDHHTLQLHQRVHTGERPYQCTQCEKTFTCQRNLKLHQHIHSGEKPYQCYLCGKSFIRQGYLQSHQRIHTGEKPYECLQCGKSFTDGSNLKQHERVHTGEKPFYCSQCGKSFSQQSNLKAHQRIHTGENLFRCSECGCSFVNLGTLKKHKCKSAELADMETPNDATHRL